MNPVGMVVIQLLAKYVCGISQFSLGHFFLSHIILRILEIFFPI